MTDRLAALRAEIKAMGVDGVIIPRGDAVGLKRVRLQPHPSSLCHG